MSGARVSTLLATAMLIPLASDAIVVRHDRDDSAFLELADTYRCTVTFMDADPAALSGMGTLIDRQWVLTAAHVAVGLSSTSIAEIAARAYPIAQIVLHPQWHRDADVRVDIAMVRLAQPVEGCAPVRLYTGVDEAGLVVTFVGRGAKGTGLSGVDGGGWDGQLRAATNRVVRADGPLLQFRFDAPRGRGGHGAGRNQRRGGQRRTGLHRARRCAFHDRRELAPGRAPGGAQARHVWRARVLLARLVFRGLDPRSARARVGV